MACAHARAPIRRRARAHARRLRAPSSTARPRSRRLLELKEKVADLCDLQPTPASMVRPPRKEMLSNLRGELAAALADVEEELDAMGGSVTAKSVKSTATARTQRSNRTGRTERSTAKPPGSAGSSASQRSVTPAASVAGSARGGGADIETIPE